MKTIALTAAASTSSYSSGASQTEPEQELDELERPVTATPAPAAPAQEGFPITINAEDVREFYPRKGGRTGTRIVYKNGAARPVLEAYEEVVGKFASLNN